MLKILGISEEHDCGACLIDTQGNISAVNEERYTRKKLERGFPKKSLAYLVAVSKKSKHKINCEIAVASKFHVSEGLGDWTDLDLKYRVLEKIFSVTRLDRIIFGSKIGPILLERSSKLQQISRKKRIKKKLKEAGLMDVKLNFFDHHLCHGAAAYFTSGWNKCLVITADASGDGYCSKVFICQDGKMAEVFSVPFFHSVGHYFEYVTLILGFKIGQEGKVMGLSAMGSSDKTYPIFAKLIKYDGDKKQPVNLGYYRQAQIKILKKLLMGFKREDVAAGVQKLLEEVMIKYVRDMLREFHSDFPAKLALSGGIFANVRLNQKIAELKGVSKLYVFPHMGDGGLAMGAAFALKTNNKYLPKKTEGIFLGDDINSEEIVKMSQKYAKQIKEVKNNNMAKQVAQYLAKGKVVCLAKGNMEYGPRALGHRSILASASDLRMVSRLNKSLKRDNFMPFAPMVRNDDLKSCFKGWQKVLPSLPFMTVTLTGTEKCRGEAPAVVHQDGTSRPQVVSKQSEPFVYELLTEYKKISGQSILINTSFNRHEEPIVRTAEQAIKTFLSSKLDILVLNEHIFEAYI